MISFEKAKEHDLKHIMQIIKTNMYQLQIELGLKWEDKVQEEHFRKKDNYFIRRQDQIIGMISFKIGDDDIFVNTLQLLSEFQKKMNGFLVYKKLVELCYRLDKKYIRCCVFENNPAMQIYKKMGFKIIGEKNKIFRMELELKNAWRQVKS